MIEKITDPSVSIWINSSAGCGKTTLLVKRLLSLLVHKEKNILCITFTKVAAAEMYNRIFHILGKLPVMNDEEINEYIYSTLKRRINDFDYVRKLIYTADSYIQIQTLHSFCWQSIKKWDPQYLSKEIYEENKHTFSNLLRHFIYQKCRLPDRTAEITTEKKLHEMLSFLMGNFHLNYKEMLEKLTESKGELPINSMDILSVFNEFLEVNRDIPRYYISYNGIIETAINKEIWNIYEVAKKIDHILLDEAQDNNLKQWYIFTQLCRDFLIDEISNKSIFIVGDYKQSIYGFQGANPDIYLAFYDILKKRDPHNKLTPFRIEKSYRSSTPILEFVDTVFANVSLCETYRDKIHHIAERSKEAGYIEVTTLIKKSELDAELQLAISIKDKIQNWLESGKIIKAKKRPIAPSDILILVAHRTNFIEYLHTQLTSAHIPVNFTGKFAVKNNPLFELLIELGRFLTYKYDDEALIKVLKSPIFGWKENDILKVKRTNKDLALFSHIENTKTGVVLKNWLKLYGTTFEIYSKILKETTLALLTNHYGNETPYYVDTFLDNTLEHNCIHNFIYIFTGEDAALKVKNCNEDGITISTVHGSKGTQSSIVFVADSNYVPQNRDTFFFTEDGIPLLYSEKNFKTTEKIRNLKKESIQYEHLRLLYVALTRAEDELYITGTGEKIKKNSWHEMCTQGMMKIGSMRKDGSYYYTNDPGYFHKEEVEKVEESSSNNSSDMGDEDKITEENQNTYTSTLQESLLNCSRDQEKDATAEKNFEILRGRLIHKILEYIFKIKNPEEWINSFLEEYSPELTSEEKSEIRNTVFTFMKENHKIAGRSEVEIFFEGLLLRMDNIEVTEETVIIRDYKTGKEKTLTNEIVQQMDRYKRAMQAIYPEKKVITEVIWL